MYPTSDNPAHSEILQKYQMVAEEKEELTLHPKAAFSRNHQRFEEREEDHRLPYKRDVDRIIHSKGYSRYIDKTQVIYLVENDHITNRGLHVQLVSSFARGIADILRLNLDLVEAIALGHDVGHPPFGHEGEGYLSQLSEEYGNGTFTHPYQSCRLFSEIEPLNLTLAVLDGFLCHDGGMKDIHFAPKFGKSWEDHFEERELKKNHPETNLSPMTLEGCLVKICDTISYLGRDLEDGIKIGILTRDEIPNTILGRSNREILRIVAKDIIVHSYNQDFIAISKEIYHALLKLRSFNFEKIYVHPRLKLESHKLKRSYRVLFETLLQDYEAQQELSYLYKDFLWNKSTSYQENTTSIQKVIDYIAGMTDRFFIHTLEKLIIPKEIIV